MGKNKKNNLFDLTSKMRIYESDVKQINEYERSKDIEKLTSALISLDKKQSGIDLSDVIGIDSKTINYEAIKVSESKSFNVHEAAMQMNPSILSHLILIEEIECDCIVPFCFDRMKVNGNINGPATNDVTRGVIGANRYYETEYRIYNSGDTSGTTRVHKVGSLDILFSAIIPSDDRYCLLHPVGDIWIRGKSRVLGHGNSTTCFDSKIWVDYFSFLHLDGNIIESAHKDIHYDGTRSEDRTKYFSKDIKLTPHYLFFNANAGQKIELLLRIQIDTAANRDGKTWGWINIFGLPANMKSDYDTMIIKSR